MTFRSIILLLVFNFFAVFGQNQKDIDSLESKLSKLDNTIEKYHVLNQLWDNSINNDISKSVYYSDQLINLGKSLQIDTVLSFGYDKKATAYAYMGNFDSSGIYFKKALKMYEANDNYRQQAGVLRNLGQDQNIIGNLDSAFYYYDRSEKNYIKAKDTVGIADILNSKAVIYLQKGYYNLALEDAIKSEKIYSDNELRQDLNQNRLVIASIYSMMKDTTNAINYYKKTIDYFRNNDLNRQLCVSITLLAGLQIPDKSLNTETEKLINESIKISKELKAPTLIDNAMSKYGKFLFTNAQFQKAKKVQLQVIEDEINRNDEYMLAESKIDLSKTLIGLGEYKTAVNNLDQALILAEKYDLISAIPEIHGLLSIAHERQNNYTESLKHYKLFKEGNDKVNGNEQQNRFAELQTIYETDKKESEIALQNEEIKTLNIQAENDKLTKTIYGVGMFSFIAISGLVFFGFRQRMKKNRIAREKQEAILNQQIEYKKKELATQTLHLVQKNTFIQELKENLEKIKKSPELFKVEFRRLVMLLKKESAGDKDWKVFKSYFSEVHNNFDNKIKTISEDITEKEIRLASFLRMNLTTKEIASILNVLPDSVLKSKYRLKKKLGLSKDEDLNSFLNTI
jgi:tetratricopeptide (TPR) repeat protein